MSSATAAIPSKRWSRIIPVALLMYTIAFIDRNNVSFAFSGMEKDLGFGATISGLVAGIFFIGYMFLQIPGGHIAARRSAKKFVFFTLIIWGIVAFCTGFVQNTAELLIIRFILGVCEGGVWPATLVLLSKWFPLHERARANAYWMMCIPLASIIMSPISGWILHVSNWRYLFFIEGAFPWVWAIIWWFFIDDEPAQAKWISAEEKNYILTSLEEDQVSIGTEGNTDYKSVFKSGKVWMLVLYYFLMQIGFYGFSLWLPTLVKQISHSGNVGTGLLSALPWIAALIGLYINAKHSDKTGERRKHASIPVVIGSACLLASVLLGKSQPVLSMIFVIIAEGFMYAYNGVFWAIPGGMLPRETLGGAMGLINGIGNLGGFFGPFIVGYLIQSTGGNFFSGVIFLVVCQVLAAIVIVSVKVKQNYTGSDIHAHASH
ncbi:MFS transporter [Alicyclobacillus tolerans]|uniref:MFS transporter n=1 Tax=Alicyclobacillus tolerans TaxID=90970 RepID=UPI001F188E04|nr:MFS transporter [Alicyclobacillus tolerans]MCF8567925.1 MFS transporter [Alicyclobacillus tolerans]